MDRSWSIYLGNEDYDLVVSIKRIVNSAISHVKGEEITLLPHSRRATVIWTCASSLTEMIIRAEKKTLFASFRAAPHPLALGHKFDILVRFRYKDNIRFFLYLDNFFPSVLGKEYACGHLDHYTLYTYID